MHIYTERYNLYYLLHALCVTFLCLSVIQFLLICAFITLFLEEYMNIVFVFSFVYFLTCLLFLKFDFVVYITECSFSAAVVQG